MSQRKLFVGLDIRNDYTMIAVLAPGQTEPELLSVSEAGDPAQVETAVPIPGTKDRLEGFLDKICRQEKIIVSGKESDPVNVMAAFLRRTLSLTKKKYPGDTIRQLVITIQQKDLRLINTIYRALEKLGIGKDRSMVADRQQSYIYYVMSQRKELWVNKVGLFDFEKDRLTYYQMQTDRFRRPVLVTVKERDYSDYAAIFNGDDNTPEEKASIFEGMVQGAIHGEIITTLYMSGEGFENGFADGVMKKLCVGRHLFRGDNLYVSGACYCARELSGMRKLEEFVYLDEDTVSSHITAEFYTDAKVQEVMLAKAGTPWYQIDQELDIIPDGDEELELRIRNVVTKESVTRMIPMEGIGGRTGRLVRIGLQLRFAGPNRCIVTVRDKGFGDKFPSSCRIWEEVIQL